MAEKKMTAPPSTAKRIVEVPEMFQALIDARGTKGRFVGADEVDIRHVLLYSPSLASTSMLLISSILTTLDVMPFSQK